MFAPLLGLWGALLGGLTIMAMPYRVVGEALNGTLLGSWGEAAQIVSAAFMAALFGSAMFALGAVRHARARRRNSPWVVPIALRQVTPINPAVDLGSRRLDDPIEAMPFTTPAWRDADLDASAHDPSAQPEAQAAPRTEPEFEPAAEADTFALDLAEFNEVLADPPPAPIQPARHLRAVESERPPVPGTAALARLRGMPPEELSMAEMVERFAAALHEHRETQPAHSSGSADLAAREAALAEALKALAALSGGNAAAARSAVRDEPLRAALSQLQPRRGVA